MRTFTLGTRPLLLGTLLLASFFVVAPFVHAQTAAAAPNFSVPAVDTSSLTAPLTNVPTNADGSVNFNASNAGVTGTNAFTPTATSPSTALAPTAAGNSGSCSATDVSSWGDCLLNAVAVFILGFMNFLLGIAGVLLNWVVVKTVFQFSLLIGNSSGLIASWKILRDIGNLILLFGFILMGIGTILDTNKLPDKKAIPMLIIFAVLLNFSIFASEAVIDTSNVLTSVMYAQANTDPCFTDSCNINNGIAGHILESTGLSGILNQGTGSITNKTFILVGLTLFSTIGTIVLLAAAIMLAFRAITLTGLIIVSPIGFAGMAIPQLQGMAKKWWKLLIHQAFFAPILFLLIFVDLKVTESFSSLSNNNGLASALSGIDVGNMGIIMVFALICGGLIAALMAAKSFGAMGANMAINAATKLTFGTQNLTYGLAGRGLRAAGQHGPLANTSVGRTLASTGRFFEQGGADTRRVPGVTGVLKTIGAGEAAKPHDSLKETTEKLKNSPLNLAKRSREDRAKYDAEMGAIKSSGAKRGLQNEARSDASELGDEQKKNLAKQSVKSLEQMSEIKKGNKKLVDNLSTDQFEGLMKSDVLSDSEKGAIRGARFKAVSDAMSGPPADLKAQLNRMSKNDLESLPPDILTNTAVLEQLTDKQREDLMGSNKRTASEKEAIRKASPAEKFKDEFASAATPADKAIVAGTMGNRLTIPQVAKLDNATLTDSLVAEQLTSAMLIELQEQKKLKASDVQAIGAHIAASPTAKGRAYVQGVGGTYWS